MFMYGQVYLQKLSIVNEMPCQNEAHYQRQEFIDRGYKNRNSSYRDENEFKLLSSGERRTKNAENM